MSHASAWLAVGLGGQLLFTGRFLVQWLASERARRSVVPHGFWYLSIGGGLTLLAYAIHQLDPVFIAGQLLGVVIYGRNLLLIHRSVNRAEQPVAQGSAESGSHASES